MEVREMTKKMMRKMAEEYNVKLLTPHEIFYRSLKMPSLKWFVDCKVCFAIHEFSLSGVKEIGIIFKNKSNKRTYCFLHELGHTISKRLWLELPEEIKAWENAYGLADLHGIKIDEKKFFSFMVECLESYGWQKSSCKF